MVQIQIFAIKNFTTILAHVPVTLKNVVSRELHFLLWQTIKHHQQNHARDTNLERNGVNALRMRFLARKILPLAEIESLENAVVTGLDDIGVSFKQKSQSAARSADVDRLPEPIQNEDMLI